MTIDWNDALNIPSMEIRSGVINDWFNDARIKLAKFDGFDRIWKSSNLITIRSIKMSISFSKELDKKIHRLDDLRISI